MDGIEIFREKALELDVHIEPLIEATAMWVDPVTFGYLPVWYPEYHRRCVLYNAEWSKAYIVAKTEIEKVEANERGKEALTKALYGKSKGEDNWTCCHIWGIDDPQFKKPNTVVQNAKYYSNVANMVNLPTPLKAFTDCMPSIKKILRICSLYTYGWSCPEIDEEFLKDLEENGLPSNYPDSWPKKMKEHTNHITKRFNREIKRQADNRIAQVKREYLQHLNNDNYPSSRVKDALEYASKFASSDSPLNLDPFWK